MRYTFRAVVICIAVAIGVFTPRVSTPADHNDPNAINSIFADVPVNGADLYDLFGFPVDNDRVLVMPPRAVRVFLPGGGDEGLQSVLARIRSIPAITSDCQVASVMVRDGEHGADAFERLKTEGELHPL